MARLTLTDARGIMLRGRPWTFRMEVTSGGRSAMWLATGRGQYEPVEVHFGAIGAKPQILVKDWDYVERTAPEKEAKGYVYVNTPFVRVQDSTINSVSPSHVVPLTPSNHVIPLTPSNNVIPLAPSNNVIPLTPSSNHVIPLTPSNHVIPTTMGSSFPPPWDRIRAVKSLGGGLWAGLDSNGNVVLRMPLGSAQRLVQSGNNIQVQGL